MTKTNNQHNTNANWVVGAVALLLVLLAGILAFYNYWRLHEASEISSTQSEITVDTASVDSATSAGSVPVSSESATGGMVLHTPLPLSNSLDSTVVSTQFSKTTASESSTNTPLYWRLSSRPNSRSHWYRRWWGLFLCRCQCPLGDHERISEWRPFHHCSG